MNVVSFAKHFLDAPIDRCRGCQSIRIWRFLACLLAMIVSLCILAKDPLFFNDWTGFQYSGGVLCILASYLVLSALFWDLLLFGKPDGANLFLQCCSFVPFTLFMARTFIRPTEGKGTTLLEEVWKSIEIVEGKIGFSKLIGGVLPGWITDIFSHWSIALVLLCIVGSLCIKKENLGWKVALLFTVVFVGVAEALATHVSCQYIIGSLFLIVAFVLIYDPYEKKCFYYNLLSDLDGKLRKNELAVVTQIMSEAYRRDKHELSYKTVAALIQSDFPVNNLDERELHKYVGIFVERYLLHRFNFVTLSVDSSGEEHIKVNPRLFVYDSLTSSLAIYPRILIVAMIGVVWLVSPVDIMPDAIPFIGVLDDAVITILSLKCIMTSRNEVLGKSS